MDTTTAEILANFKKKHRHPDSSKIDRIIKQLYDQNIIPYQTPCMSQHHHTKTRSIDYELLYETQQSEFYNYQLLQDVMCQFSGQLMTWNKPLGDYGYTKRVGLLRSLSSGTNATVYTNLMNGDSNGYFVIKTSDDYDEEDFKREVITTFIVSILRQRIPNFMMIFGSFMTKNPMNISDDLYMLGIQGDTNGYMVLENIFPSITVKEFLTKSFDENNKKLGQTLFKKDFGTKEFLLLLTQIVLSLKIAYKELKFTHYDLNDDNVMIRAGKQGSFIRYGNQYTKGDVVATLIDFGYSSIEYDGNSIGVLGYEEYGITNKPFPMHDVYKFYMFCMKTIQKSKHFKELSKIFKFFNKTDTIISALTRQGEALYGLPYTPENASVSHDDFIEFLIKMYPEYDFVYDEPKGPLLTCKNFDCHVIEDFESEDISDPMILYNWLKHGKDIIKYKKSYDSVKNELKTKTLLMIAKARKGIDVIRYASTSIANMTILNDLENHYHGSPMFKQTAIKEMESLC